MLIEKIAGGEDLGQLLQQFSNRRKLISSSINEVPSDQISPAIAGLLEVALFRLAVPLIKGIELDPNFITTNDSGNPHVMLSYIFGQVMELRDKTVQTVATNFQMESALGLIATEYAEHRREISRVTGGPPQEQLSNVDVVLQDIRTGFGSGARQILRLIEVFPRVALDYGIEPTAEQLLRLKESRLVLGLARMRAWWQPAFERVANGCTEHCFSQTWEEVQTLSPHREWIRQYDDHQSFMRFHWLDMWFDHSQFAMFGEDPQNTEIGLKSKLEETLDPRSGQPIGKMSPRRKRLGCPALFTGGVDALTRTLIEVCSRSQVWDPIVEFHLTHRTEDRIKPRLHSGEWGYLH